MDCPVIVRSADEGAEGSPARIGPLPIVCDCECHTCKRAWWSAGRPLLRDGKIFREDGTIVREGAAAETEKEPMDKQKKDDILAGIKDPTVREHYRKQLEMAENVDGIPSGGIFNAYGVEDVVTTGEILADEESPPEPTDGSHTGVLPPLPPRPPEDVRLDSLLGGALVLGVAVILAIVVAVAAKLWWP
jgi:hypothetical protein